MNVPTIDAGIENAARRSGSRTASAFPKSAPRNIDATMVTAYVSKRSAAMPASSPTLSPTLSAMTAGLRGSSSGIPASILPTRSAPTSAPFVKMPPPRRAKTEISEPPNASPTRALVAARSLSPFSMRMPKYPPTPSRPRPTTRIPVTVPPLKATERAGFMPDLAASAVRTFERTATFIPMKPVSAERTAPIMKPIATFHPRSSVQMPAMPIARNTTTATTAMVVYCRFRYAAAPSWMAAAISRMRSVPADWASTQRVSARP